MTPTSHEYDVARLLWEHLRLGQEAQPTEWIWCSAVTICPSRIVPPTSTTRVLLPGLSSPAAPAPFPTQAIVLEKLASNTSENFWFTAELLRDLGIDAGRFLVVQKPYAERRIIATARRRWPDKEVRVTSATATFERYVAGPIATAKIFSMLVGEILRLDAYGRTGLIESGEIPADLLAAARELESAGYDARALA